MSVSGSRQAEVELYHLGGTAGSVALICAPYAGGGNAIFRSWPKSLPSVDFYALSLPGREARFSEPPFSALNTLVTSAVEAMRPLESRAFALFGHSMGGLVAFEVARQLRRSNARAPIHLFVSGFRAPHLPDPKPPLFDLPRVRFIDELRRISAPNFDADRFPELIDLMLPTLRADFRLVQTYDYRPEPALTCPVTAFGGTEDSDVGERELREWRQHTSGAFTIRMLPGGHFFLQTQSRALLREVDRHLRSTVQDARAPFDGCSAGSVHCTKTQT
ncbi:thioesterase II family protein [Bradyrhizobium liaoningense]|uniref:thioesterase II family protein n=1 Tax=Bradyrhizobium liaoningense TaxID=43992 RepID=UPI001BAB062F|nr:alpha/beta fold hydrolase [Bradyrhizobium liaoningense]MBR0820277.1 thioesterase [Bradyrhizobium liaoningense]